MFTVIAAIGTTLTPWGQFFIQAAVVDKKVSWKQFAYTKYEIYAGSVFMTTIDFFIVLACAATLYEDGIVVQSAEEAAMALVPFLGAAAQYLFAIGLLSVSILAAGVLPLATAYVVCEAFGFESGLDNSFREAPVFNGLITFLMFVPAAVAMIPGLPLVDVILVAQSLNGILLPVILIFTLHHDQQPARDGRARQREGPQRDRLDVHRHAHRHERRPAPLPPVHVMSGRVTDGARDGRRPRTPARCGRVGRSRLLIFFAILGPGLISAAADNDAGGITTWSVIGARYGYSMLWLLLLITPILAVTQEMGARMGAVTGKGLAALIREKFSLKVTAFAMLALLVANFGTTTAEFSGIAAAFSLAHVPAWAAVPPVAFGVWLLVTRGTYRKVERVFLALTAVYVAYFIAGFLARPDWGSAVHGTFVPQVQMNSLWILTAIAAVGTTITPWGQFFIQAYIVDKRISIARYAYTKLEVYLGAMFTDAIDLFIVLACAATLYREGIVVETAQDAARALAPLAGEAAYFLFGFGLLNVSILGAAILPLTTAYAICEAFGLESGLDRKWSEAPAFNGILTTFIAIPALVAIIPNLPLVKVMLLSQDVNGILLPIILIYVLKIINDRDVMGEHVNGPRVQHHRLGVLDRPDRALGDAGRVDVPLLRTRRRRAGGRSRPGPSVALEPVRRARLDVHQHVGVGDAGADVVLDVLGDVVRLGDGEVRVDHHVQVDVPAAAGAAGAQLVVAADDVAAVLAHAAADLLELLLGQRLVEQHARGLHHQVVARLDDEHGDGDGGDGVEVGPAGDLDEQQADGHAERRVHVGEQVGGVRLERGRLRAPRHRVQHLLRDDEVGDAGDQHHADAEPDVVDLGAVDDLHHALEDDHGRGGDDEQRLDDAAEVLDLLVAVVVALVGRLGRLPHRPEGDERGHQVGARVQRLGDDGDGARRGCRRSA